MKVDKDLCYRLQTLGDVSLPLSYILLINTSHYNKENAFIRERPFSKFGLRKKNNATLITV